MALNQRSRTVLTLYSAQDCIHGHRVRMTLAAKGVTYDHVLVDLNNAPHELLELNPYHSVPTLVDRDLVLYDTGVICEYLDERYPHPPLMPVDPLSRARLRLAIARIENDWVALVEQIEAGGKGADAARKALREELLRNASAFKASRFFLSPEISLADCALAPLVWRLSHLGVQLPKEAQSIIDYGERIFHSQGFARSVTPFERTMRP
ncbi:MAG: glutathione S-transferase N-terminal domain-containing protein [Dokdonella sp.]|uniref:glutathione S-transferase N-terminal domain-containing protein n=1 Tax=Dokdonella sp. TaxID=2291710 RepID=UPI0025B99FD4|nr:glutathione S-transferase N-terminal domain-containing protein [Dokdonella sp.]MBX3699844.1 glutathione S-transferase N-terminal domain-containing protein [Dokdonella sp.]MCW5578341.1 glutathione S-transferase N-terminal domain-containing protein [Dokdonella sp.]